MQNHKAYTNTGEAENTQAYSAVKHSSNNGPYITLCSNQGNVWQQDGTLAGMLYHCTFMQ
jgi:hypothetical protein